MISKSDSIFLRGVAWLACVTIVFQSRFAYGLSTTLQKPLSVESSSRPTIFPNSVPAQSSDIATLVRQTGQVNPSKAAIGVPSTCHCQHGFPQAFAMDPVHAGRMNSGLLKLTCPLLVRAVDALEDDGVIQALNQRLATDSSLQSEIKETHNRHAQVRKAMLSSSELKSIRSKLGDAASGAFLSAGVAGASPTSTDLKCLHAWLADTLFAGETTTLMGDILKKELGMDVSGTSSCQRSCNVNLSSALANPPKPRNKQRLRTSKELERRKRRKKELQQ